MSQNGTKNNRKKQLTPKQRQMAEALINPELDCTITELCEKMGVPRRTYYNWLDNPAFTEYMTSLIEKYASSELGEVWKSLIARCKSGDTKAMRLYFERLDKVNDKKPDNTLDRILEAFNNV